MGNVTSASASCRCSGRTDQAKELLRSAEVGDLQALSVIIEDDVRFVMHTSVFGGNTAWHKAAKGGRADVLEALAAVIVQQYEMDSKDLYEPVKPSVLRLGSSAADAVTRLINKSNLKGMTPLMLACAGCHTEAVSWLIKHGADVWKHDRVRRHTGLHCAAEAGATDAIRLLLAHTGADVHPGNGKTLLEQGNHAGLTALHYAVHCEQQEVVAQLVAQDADITAQAEFPDLDWGCVNAGDTAMHIAAVKGNLEAIQIMLKAYNEKSGSLLPGSDGPRRLRDPRAMRNDYGRLPYHLAMRKGLTWLGEMLDPSVPVRFLLTDQQLDTNTMWGPPRLATIAAAVLHRSLVADLKAIQAIQQADAASQCTATAAAKAAPQPAYQPSRQQPQQEQLRAPTLAVTGASPSQETASSSGAGLRRRWGFPGHQRSNSDAGIWSAQLIEPSPRPSTGSRRHLRLVGMATVDTATSGATRGSSRRGRTVAVAAGTAAAAAAALAVPSWERTQEALCQLSPRALVAAFVGTGSNGAPAESVGGASTGATAPSPVAGESGTNGCDDLDVAGPSAPSSASTWKRLVARQVRLGAGKQQQHQQQACASPGPWYADSGRESVSDDHPSEFGQQQHHSEPNCLPRSASDSFCLMLDEDEDWHKLPAIGVFREAAQQEQQELLSDDFANGAAAGKVSPLPELKPGLPSSAVDVLLKQFDAELRRSVTASPELSGTANISTDCQLQCDNISDEAMTCGVCLDALPTALIQPCEHSMCADCALDMCERCPLGTAVCPFCRCVIRNFRPVNCTASTVAGAMANAASVTGV